MYNTTWSVGAKPVQGGGAKDLLHPVYRVNPFREKISGDRSVLRKKERGKSREKREKVREKIVFGEKTRGVRKRNLTHRVQ